MLISKYLKNREEIVIIHFVQILWNGHKLYWLTSNVNSSICHVFKQFSTLSWTSMTHRKKVLEKEVFQINADLVNLLNQITSLWLCWNSLWNKTQPSEKDDVILPHTFLLLKVVTTFSDFWLLFWKLDYIFKNLNIIFQ